MLIFQKENVDLGGAYDDLRDLIILLARKILKPIFISDNFEELRKAFSNELAYVSVNEADFGIEYYEAACYKQCTKDEKENIETRAYNFIKKLSLQLIERLPISLKFFQQLKCLSPKICLSQTRPKFKNLPFLKEMTKPNDLGILESQWNKLLSIDWAEVFGENVLNDCYSFWPCVYSFKSAGDKYVFKEIALFALELLSLPSSNAVVERVFSIMNAIKTKARNKMLVEMLDSIIRIRMSFYANNACCTSFIANKSMLADFNSKIVYPDKRNVNDNNMEEMEIEVCDILQEFNLPCISLSDI